MIYEKTYVKDIHPHRSIDQYLWEKYSLSTRIQAMRPKKNHPKLLAFKHADFSSEAVLSAVFSAFDQYGYHGFRNPFSQHGERGNYYGGLSLTYNPFSQTEDIHAGTMGAIRHNMHDFLQQKDGPEAWRQMVLAGLDRKFMETVSRGGLLAGRDFLLEIGLLDPHWTINWDKPVIEKKGGPIRGTYSDTFGFCALTPAAKQGALGEFLCRLKRSIVRSRIAVIDASFHEDHYPEFMWHRDESIFINLRLNIPLTTDDCFQLEIADSQPFGLSVGKIYSFDTGRAHRVFSKLRKKQQRIHLVIGVSPWFDYLPDEDAWVPNSCFGEVHPFDMLCENLVLPGLERCEEY